MALSTRLIRRLEGDGSDEPLAKRLKLAGNVLCSSDTLIFRKEECIFRWLCGELSGINDTEVWMTIHRCLALDPKSFSKLAPATKTLLIDHLTGVLKEYPHKKVLVEMIKCCGYIFLSTQSYSKEDRILDLIEVLFEFANKILNSNDEDKCVEDSVVLECAECAISTFSQSYRQRFSEKQNYMAMFIEKLLFPLSSLVTTIKNNNLSSKIVIEAEKCIKRLLLGSIKNIALSSEEEKKKVEEAEVLFSSLKNKAGMMKLEDIKTAFTFLFQFVVKIFQQNLSLIDVILRKLVNCTEQKEQSKQILTALIENSFDVSYNFDYEINGISLKEFLKIQIEEIIAKKKHLKSSDYELLSAVSKINPLVVEDLTQNILERILFEKKKNESEKIAQENVVKELWKSSIRLRRHNKFLSKFLLVINNIKEKQIDDLELISKFELPKSFIAEFSEDVKNKTTSAQILAMFHTLIYHLKTDCLNNIQNTVPTVHECLMIKVVSKLFVIFLESSNFLDNSLPRDWQIKFYNAFSDLRNHLALFAEKLCETEDNFKIEAFLAFSDVVKIWCETYDLLRYYLPSSVANELSFPVDEANLNEFKQIIKKTKDQNCKTSLNQLLLFELVIYNKDNQQSIKEKMIKQLWSLILENHFELIESFNEKQILELTLNLVQEACSSRDALLKWSSILKQNISRMTKKFATAAVLQATINLVEDVDLSTSKTVTETIDFASVLQSLDDSAGLKNILSKAKKEFSRQHFKSLDTVDIDKVKRNLVFLSNLPLSYLNTDVRTFLFMVLYTFEEEIKNSFDVKGFFTNLYLDFLHQNDVNILDCVSQPSVLISHFKDNQLILLKIFKRSLISLPALEFWEEFIKMEECDKKLSSILLACIVSAKSESFTNEHKTSLHNLTLKLSSKITKGLKDHISDADEVAGLRISLKIIFSEKKKLKDNLKKSVESIIKNVVTSESISNDKLIQEILQLSLFVLLHRENFDIDEAIIKKLCIALINNPEGKIFSRFFEAVKDSEFDYFGKTLCNHTKDLLISGNVQALEKVITIWESLSKAEAKVVRSKSFKSSVNTYFNDLLISEIHEASPVFVLKICRTIITSKRIIRLSNEIIDSVFVVSEQCLDKLSNNKLLTCQEALGLCLDYLRSKSEYLLDRLFVLTKLFCKIVQIVLQEGKAMDFSDEQTLRILVIDIEKFCTFFAKLKKDVARISPYLIADLLEIISRTGVLPNYLKIALDSSISHLLINCDQYAIRFLSRTLPVSTQQVFKTIYDHYTKYHKFTGKI